MMIAHEGRDRMDGSALCMFHMYCIVLSVCMYMYSTSTST